MTENQIAELKALLNPLLEKPKPVRDIRSFRDILAILVLGSFIMMVPMLLWKTPGDAVKEIIVYMVGQISGVATTIIAYYFGKSMGEDKRQVESQVLAEKQVDALHTANNNLAAVVGANTGQVQAADQVADAAAHEADKIKKGEA